MHLDGAVPPPSYPKVCKRDDLLKVTPGLFVMGGVARFDGTPLVTTRGVVTVSGVPDGSPIH